VAVARGLTLLLRWSGTCAWPRRLGWCAFELAIARCVRAHGVPDYPDPNSHGVLPRARLSAIQRSPLAQKENTALGVCARMLNHTYGRVTGRMTSAIPLAPQVQRRLTACLRAHGLSRFADFGSDKKAFLAYIDTHLPELRRAGQACNGLLPHF
jgi:hypothetical protein